MGERRKLLTDLIKHFVALIENEILHRSKIQSFVANQRVQPTWSGNDNVRVCVSVLQCLDILLDGRPAIEDAKFQGRHVFAEALKLVANLVCQFARVTHDQGVGLARNWLDLLKGR